ncbi:hypothetical protein [Halobacillus ihumii]|uniref:hypothetical protein n=1 Tax=Halobacillus ihumii TaxID=2686092 RepID=UPI0013D7CF6C|nr:hypothetical protein [Halobacillus ihumii]
MGEIKSDAEKFKKHAELALNTYNDRKEWLIRGEDDLEDGQFQEAILMFKKVLEGKDQFDNKKFNEVTHKANELLRQAQGGKLYDELSNKLQSGENKLEKLKFDEAISIFEQIAKHEIKKESSRINKVKDDASELLEQTLKAKEQYLAEQRIQEEKRRAEEVRAEEKKENEEALQEKKEQGQSLLTHQEAKNLVYKYLLNKYTKTQLNNPNVFLEYDHDKDNGDYIFRLYEVVIDNPETKEGHQATWG